MAESDADFLRELYPDPEHRRRAADPRWVNRLIATAQGVLQQENQLALDGQPCPIRTDWMRRALAEVGADVPCPAPKDAGGL